MTFASTITGLRYALRLTQAELAALLRVDKQSVSNWECGRNAPWPARQVEIIKLLQSGAPGYEATRNSGEGGPVVTRDWAGAPPCRPNINERILRP